MKVGDMVKITRASIGVPANQLGLIIETNMAESGFYYHSVQMSGIKALRRYLERDLEIISESR